MTPTDEHVAVIARIRLGEAPDWGLIHQVIHTATTRYAILHVWRPGMDAPTHCQVQINGDDAIWTTDECRPQELVHCVPCLEAARKALYSRALSSSIR